MRKRTDEKKKMKKGIRGITLIALVVTIVILLIVGGVSLNLVFSNNGIITKSEEAKEKWDEARRNEEISLGDIEEGINLILDTESSVKDSTPGVLSGEGTESSPYLIESIEDLVAFALDVNNGNEYENKVVLLYQTINFNSDISYVDPNTEQFGDINNDGNIEGLKKELEKGIITIGYVEGIQYGSEDLGGTNTLIGKPFKGVFNGNNRAIKGINMQELYSSEIGAGLFGWSDGKIENLITSGYANFTEEEGFCIGGIAAFANGEITNCVSCVDIESSGNAGGIVGEELGTLTISKCTNLGKIIGYTSGGIVGKTINNNMSETREISIISCTNNAEINGACAGGIIGVNSGTNMIIDECNNTGTISLNAQDSHYNIGGIIGENYISSGGLNTEITNCYNTGAIKSDNEEAYAGGIIGYSYLWSTSNIFQICNSYNAGNISGNAENIGGIAGFCEAGGNINILNNYNSGNISGNYVNVAGIIGMAKVADKGNININLCYNRGDIDYAEADIMGGIVGLAIVQHQYYLSSAGSVKVNNCYNIGKLINKSINDNIYIGGICGKTTANSKGSTYIMNSFNSGIIEQAGGYKGGILGKKNEETTRNVVNNCYYNNNILGGINESDVPNSAEFSEILPDIISVMGTEFKEDTENINKGYPILKWQ